MSRRWRLLRWAGNVNQLDVNGYGALAQAVVNGHLKIARKLIAAGADPHASTIAGNTLLMLAVMSRKPALVEYLLARKPNLDSRNQVGDSALMLVAARGQNRIWHLLVAAGADLQLRNNEDLNAYQIAVNAGHRQSAKIIHDNSNFVFKLFN